MARKAKHAVFPKEHVRPILIDSLSLIRSFDCVDIHIDPSKISTNLQRNTTISSISSLLSEVFFLHHSKCYLSGRVQWHRLAKCPWIVLRSLSILSFMHSTGLTIAVFLNLTLTLAVTLTFKKKFGTILPKIQEVNRWLLNGQGLEPLPVN